MDYAICSHIKRDSSICRNKCWQPTGCYRHWSLHEKNIEKFPCGICEQPTISITGYCPKHSGRFHSLNNRMKQKGLTSKIVSRLEEP
ncbi:hypothetical protein F8M41_006671 [Gigaspora margarita]|uniref:Uncharacterized protein n=1 Tax=Gigaspora margarita TaxID=4874 RepID=A0A8H4A536_GIGMA|nr:hypothetical protein F8M41_006671 [Gigaspora margarita]